MMYDYLSRQSFINLLKNIIANQTATKSGDSIAIDGERSSGKTWILNELEKQLDIDYLVFHYNAWQNDYYEVPLTAILSILIRFPNKIKKDRLVKIEGEGIKSFVEKLDNLLVMKQSIKGAALFPSARLDVKENDIMNDLL